MRIMHFEWDEKKNRKNFAKHGIWFEEAQTLWADENAIEFLDPDHGDEESRFLRVGHSLKERLLLVVFCEKLDGDVVRLISARKTTKKEKREYEEGI